MSSRISQLLHSQTFLRATCLLCLILQCLLESHSSITGQTKGKEIGSKTQPQLDPRLLCPSSPFNNCLAHFFEQTFISGIIASL